VNVSAKVALITGGETGLARLGCSIAVNHIAVTRDDVGRTVAELTALGARSLAVEADVTNSDACHAMVATVVRALAWVAETPSLSNCDRLGSNALA
jgi:NAD(P)-dependent dehydrogenase (short-subunit alcohol dehydrogenase family)